MEQNAHHGSGHDSSTEGTMDISEHIKTWNAFWDGIKWSSIALVIIAVLLAIFRTNQ